ncbi:MAG: hypothetical protein IPN26_10895 [Bacteroidetes bacterium]|nr:hypothetical protein [Bacteroidota bacterium]
MLAFSLYTLTWQEAEKPTLQRVAQQLNIHLSDVDADFRMVCIDEVQKTYCVMISQEALQKNTKQFKPGRGIPFEQQARRLSIKNISSITDQP